MVTTIKTKERTFTSSNEEEAAAISQHYHGHQPTPTILQSSYSLAETANPYVKLSFHQIHVPFQFIIPLTPLSSSIFIRCIPVHSAIPSNDLADRAVKEATTITTDANHPVSFSSSIQVINETMCDSLPSQERVALIYQHRKTSRDAKEVNNRKDDVILACLRSIHHPSLRQHLK